MSRIRAQIVDALMELTKPKDITLQGEVYSLDMEHRTCHIKCANGCEMPVMLQVLMGETGGVVVIPKIGATVEAIRIEYNYLMIGTTEIEKVIALVGNINIEVGTDGIIINGESDIPITINGGNNDGLVKVVQLTDRLNKLETAVSDIISKHNAHTHPYVDTGAPVPASITSVTTSVSTQVVTQTSKEQIENDKIKH